MAGLLEALEANLKGHERTMKVLLNKTPKYTNDDEYADAVLTDLFNALYDEVNRRKNTKERVGGPTRTRTWDQRIMSPLL